MDNDLLTITFKDINSNPVICYEGKQIDKITDINLDWKTKDNKHDGLFEFNIMHVDFRDGKPYVKTTGISR